MSEIVEITIESGASIEAPLNTLKASPRNARRTPHTQAAVEALAGSIAAKGVLQPLVVEPELNGQGERTGFWLVTIGEGRRLALRLLAKRKRIKKTHLVRCVVDLTNDPHEISLDENVTRFALMAVQLFVVLIEFKLTTLGAFVLVPFGLFGPTAFLAERALGGVVASGVKVMALGVITGIGAGLFDEFLRQVGGQPSIDEVMAMSVAAMTLLGLCLFAPSIATALASGAPQLGAGSVAGTGALVAGGVLAGAAGIGALRAGAAGASAAFGARRAAPAAVSAASTGSARAASASAGGAAKSEAAPAWAQQLRRRHAAGEAASAAMHAARSGDSGGGSTQVSLKENDR